jgi:hypothetical protein
MAMDDEGHEYGGIYNIRLTHPADDRAAKNWANQDLVRIQSYRGAERGRVPLGAPAGQQVIT